MIARADADRFPLLHLAENALGVLGLDWHLAGEIVDRQVGRLLAGVAFGALEVEKAVVVQVADHELREASSQSR